MSDSPHRPLRLRAYLRTGFMLGSFSFAMRLKWAYAPLTYASHTNSRWGPPGNVSLVKYK